MTRRQGNPGSLFVNTHAQNDQTTNAPEFLSDGSLYPPSDVRFALIATASVKRQAREKDYVIL